MLNDLTSNPTNSLNRPRGVRVLFAGSHCIGLFADEIDAIADWRTPAPLPDAPAVVLGVASVHGRMLTVLSARVLLGEATAETGSKIVGLRGDEQVALAVDRTGELIELAPDELLVPNEAGTLLLGVISRADQSVSILDSKQLFATAMRGRERRRRRF